MQNPGERQRRSPRKVRCRRCGGSEEVSTKEVARWHLLKIGRTPERASIRDMVSQIAERVILADLEDILVSHQIPGCWTMLRQPVRDAKGARLEETLKFVLLVPFVRVGQIVQPPRWDLRNNRGRS